MMASHPVVGHKIIDLIKVKDAEKKPYFAFEFFPPRTEAGVKNLVERFHRMKEQDPLYCDVTWGAGGATSDLTLDLCKTLQNIVGLESNMHLTCTNMEVQKIDEALLGAKGSGIRNIVALRGDPPVGSAKWEAVEGGFTCASDLVKYIRKEHGDYFGISVAGYPEGHPTVIKPIVPGTVLSASEQSRVVESAEGPVVCSDEDYRAELAYLKSKVDAGADFIITQMFYNVEVFFLFVEDCRAININCPILPGIMLIQNYGGFTRMTAFCKTNVPATIKAQVEAAKDDEEEFKKVGIRIGTEMCQQLLSKGFLGIHFYSLNLEHVVYGILANLGWKKPGGETA